MHRSKPKVDQLDRATIILGAGLSGLSASYFGGYPIYEASNLPGGTAGSKVKDDFVFDFGIHVLHSKKPWFRELMKELEIDFVWCRRNAWIYSHGRYAAYPFQVNTSNLPLRLRFRCLIDFLLRKRGGPVNNYEDWMVQNFGKGFSETFLIPYSKKFWGVNPARMTYEWTGQQRVPQPRTIDVIRGAIKNQAKAMGANPEFLYPSKFQAGFSGIAEAFADRVQIIHYGMQATAIDPDSKTIVFNGGQDFVNYDILISTLPLPDLVRLIANVPREVTLAADMLEFNSIALVNLGIDRGNVTDKHWIHCPGTEISFFRVSFPSNFCAGLNPPGTSAIQAEISYDRHNPPAPNELVSRVREDLIRMQVLKKGDGTVFEDTMFLKYGYVIYDHNRIRALDTIHGYLRSRDILACGRYGEWAYFWIDEAVKSGMETAQAALSMIERQTRLARG